MSSSAGLTAAPLFGAATDGQLAHEWRVWRVPSERAPAAATGGSGSGSASMSVSGGRAPSSSASATPTLSATGRVARTAAVCVGTLRAVHELWPLLMAARAGDADSAVGVFRADVEPHVQHTAHQPGPGAGLWVRCAAPLPLPPPLPLVTFSKEGRRKKTKKKKKIKRFAFVA